MKLNLCELKIIERLLSNRINADYDPDIDRLLCKIRKEINGVSDVSKMEVTKRISGREAVSRLFG